jgi:hypothetical protein
MFDLKVTIPNPTQDDLDRLEAITVGLDPVPMPQWSNVAYRVFWFQLETFGVARSIRVQLSEIEPSWGVQIREHTSIPGQ